MKHLVIGLGEVGSALQKVLKCDGLDPKRKILSPLEPYDMIHICFPYFDGFEQEVQMYKGQFRPIHTVIHSTVPIGTSDACKAHHSPVRGVHPHIDEGLLTFTKYVGGERSEDVSRALQVFKIPAVPVSSARDCEAMKLWDTTQYGVQILLEKEIYDFCQKHDLDFQFVYKNANQTYNRGYMELDRPEVVRPYLAHQDGKIGGHCVVNNASMLDSESARRIINFQKKHEQRT